MSAEDAFRAAHDELDAPPFPNSPGIAYSAAWVAYSEAEDRFYLVSHGCDVALPTPPELHGHFADLIAKPEERLYCHPGFVKWPPAEDGLPEAFHGAANAPRAD